MKDRIYLLSLEEAGEKPADELIQKAIAKLDCERRKKLEGIRNDSKRIESIGAGLLLQLAVREAQENSGAIFVGQKEEYERIEGKALATMKRLTFAQLLEKLETLQAPIPLEYTYGEHGKPYFKNYPVYFNISHSGKYVLCVLSEQEVGADIQLRTRKVNERVIQHFFSPEEKAYWQQCDSESGQRDFFYRMWCRKEAYAKLTGAGIGDVIRENMYMAETEEGATSLYFEEYTVSEEYTGNDIEYYYKEDNHITEGFYKADYQIAICKWN